MSVDCGLEALHLGLRGGPGSLHLFLQIVELLVLDHAVGPVVLVVEQALLWRGLEEAEARDEARSEASSDRDAKRDAEGGYLVARLLLRSAARREWVGLVEAVAECEGRATRNYG